MRVAVVGGTGLVGRYTVSALSEAGHEPVALARSRGVDVMTGQGLDEALTGVDAVIDVTNRLSLDADTIRAFFAASTEHLLAAEARAGVGHHVVLSITALQKVEGNPHYAGKRVQETLALGGKIPATVLRATQFHEFAGMVVGWSGRDGAAVVPPLLLQPVAARDVALALVSAATGEPQGLARDLAGPETQDLVDMARRTLAVRGDNTRLIPSWRGGLFGLEMAGEVLLPAPSAVVAPTAFDAWLASEDAKAPFMRTNRNR